MGAQRTRTLVRLAGDRRAVRRRPHRRDRGLRGRDPVPGRLRHALRPGDVRTGHDLREPVVRRDDADRGGGWHDPHRHRRGGSRHGPDGDRGRDDHVGIRDALGRSGRHRPRGGRHARLRHRGRTPCLRVRRFLRRRSRHAGGAVAAGHAGSRQRHADGRRRNRRVRVRRRDRVRHDHVPFGPIRPAAGSISAGTPRRSSTCPTSPRP